MAIRRAVKIALIARGVEPDRMMPKGFGGTKPVVRRCLYLRFRCLRGLRQCLCLVFPLPSLRSVGARFE